MLRNLDTHLNQQNHQNSGQAYREIKLSDIRVSITPPVRTHSVPESNLSVRKE